MSLIIAIEPDRDQAAQLKDLVRRHTGAELILADNTAGAIDAIETHVPDLVLIPAFLSPEDDEALTNALRVTEAAAHVQTLTIPVLGEPQQRSTAQGVLSKLRWDTARQASPDSCDPKLFAEQITEYLARVAKERGPIAGNGQGSHGSNGGGRKAETASAPPPPPAEKVKPAAVSKPAAASKVVSPPPQPEPPPATADIDLSALEAALSDVELDAPVPDVLLATAEPESVAADDLDGLEEGLSSLMEKLTGEESTVSGDGPASINSTGWVELKQLESIEYAIPSIAPHDDSAGVETAPPETPARAEPAATIPADPLSEKKSEWGDLMDSLKKDLGR